MLTAKQEAFAVGIFNDLTLVDAYKQAGYSTNMSNNAIYVQACKLAKKPNINLRVAELREQAVTPAIMSRTECLERLSEIGRARLTDYNQCGPDGNWIVIDKESPNTAAIKEITSVTKYDKDGDSPSVVIGIKLHDPIKAIETLGKFNGWLKQDNQDINILIQAVINKLEVNSGNVKELSDEELRLLAYGEKGEGNENSR